MGFGLGDFFFNGSDLNEYEHYSVSASTKLSEIDQAALNYEN
jgi:hypothetical protein